MIGAAKLLTTWTADGVLDMFRDADGPGGGNWRVVRNAANDEWDSAADTAVMLALTGIEATMWRLENAIAAVRTAYLSVINVG